MTNVHQCERMAEMAEYILVDTYHVDGQICETFMYEIEAKHSKAEGNRVHWTYCPHCGTNLIGG